VLGLRIVRRHPEVLKQVGRVERRGVVLGQAAAQGLLAAMVSLVLGVEVAVLVAIIPGLTTLKAGLFPVACWVME